MARRAADKEKSCSLNLVASNSSAALLNAGTRPGSINARDCTAAMTLFGEYNLNACALSRAATAAGNSECTIAALVATPSNTHTGISSLASLNANNKSPKILESKPSVSSSTITTGAGLSFTAVFVSFLGC